MDYTFGLNLLENGDSLIKGCLCPFNVIVCDGESYLFDRGLGTALICHVP